MFQRRNQSVPIDVVERLIDIHYKHLAEITERIAEVVGKYLADSAALYERALNPPQENISTPSRMFISESEEDERYLVQMAEMKALQEIAQQAGFDTGELRIE
jgi:hypothetical protein